MQWAAAHDPWFVLAEHGLPPTHLPWQHFPGRLQTVPSGALQQRLEQHEPPFVGLHPHLLVQHAPAVTVAFGAPANLAAAHSARSRKTRLHIPVAGTAVDYPAGRIQQRQGALQRSGIIIMHTAVKVLASITR